MKDCVMVTGNITNTLEFERIANENNVMIKAQLPIVYTLSQSVF